MMMCIHVAANWASVFLWAASAVLWFKAATMKVPTLTGNLSDISGAGTGELSRRLNAQSRWNAASAIISGLAALGLAIATLTASA